jgi:hypothetical protein
MIGLDGYSEHGNLAMFRCPVCGDSRSKSRKKSGYVLGLDTESPYFHCHRRNCHFSFLEFIKFNSFQLFKELFTELKKENINNFQKRDISKVTVKQKNTSSSTNIRYDEHLHTIDCFTDDHIAARYLRARHIPESNWNDLYFFSGHPYKLFKTLFDSDRYDEKLDKNLNYCGILQPFRDRNKQHIGFGLRLFDYHEAVKLSSEPDVVDSEFLSRISPDGAFRFLKLKIHDEDYLLGEDKCDFEKPVVMLEGFFDKISFSSKQFLAMQSTNIKLDYINNLANKDIVYVFDNEWDNNSINRSMKKVIDMGNRVFCWPVKWNKFKDLNDVVKTGLSESEIVRTIMKNSHKGFKAELEISNCKLNYKQQKSYNIS